jgi:hypothetical protein
MDDQEFFDQLKREIDAERDVDYSVTPEEAERLRRTYPNDMPEAFKKINPLDFFDGAD